MKGLTDKSFEHTNLSISLAPTIVEQLLLEHAVPSLGSSVSIHGQFLKAVGMALQKSGRKIGEDIPAAWLDEMWLIGTGNKRGTTQTSFVTLERNSHHRSRRGERRQV